MECHYKVLGLEMDADDESIKKAYRKAALKYHPDKNPDNLTEATEKFRLVQAAYDVLSDPQERAWYDRHREEILHRKKFENYKSNSIDLFDYFNPSVYKGFGNDEKSFFSVYRDVFNKVSSEDRPFRSSDSEDELMPTFGDADSDYDKVVHVFYATWQAYTTRMSYVWVNQYDVKEAPNRRVARIIEKENKKERDKHKKQRNELVRQLVAFVRKRDPRVKAHKMELERIAAEQAEKAEERRASLIRERVREAALYDETNREEMMKHEERIAELEGLMKDEFGFTSSDDSSQEGSSEEEYRDELFCIACNKLFKSEMGLQNHKKSKKHKEKMNQLKEEMKDETVKEETNEDNDESGITEETNRPDEQDIGSGSSRLTKKQKKKKRQQQKLLSNIMSAEPLRVSSFDQQVEVETEDPVDHDSVVTGSETIPVLNGNENLAVHEHVDKASLSNGCEDTANPINETYGEISNSTNYGSDCKSNKSSTQKKKSGESLNCVKCGMEFHSRNKLFQHLKETGHSMATESTERVKGSKRKGKKSRR